MVYKDHEKRSEDYSKNVVINVSFIGNIFIFGSQIPSRVSDS